MQDAVLSRRLSDQAVASVRVACCRLGGSAIAGDTPVAPAPLDNVDGADRGAEIGGDDVQRVLAQGFEALLALQALRDADLSRTQPVLRLAPPVVARHDDRGGGNQHEQDERAAGRGQSRDRSCAVPVVLASREQALLDRRHFRRRRPNPGHCFAAAIGQDDGAGDGLSVLPMPRDGVGEVLQLFVDQSLERLEARELALVVRHHAPQALQISRHRAAHGVVEREIALLSREKEAALPGFRVDRRREDDVDLPDDLERVGDARRGFTLGLERLPGSNRHARHRHEGDEDANKGADGKGKRGPALFGRHPGESLRA